MGCCFSKSGLAVAGEFSIRNPVSFLDSEFRLAAFGCHTDGAEGEGERVRSMSDGPFRTPGEPKDLSSIMHSVSDHFRAKRFLAEAKPVLSIIRHVNDHTLGYGQGGYRKSKSQAPMLYSICRQTCDSQSIDSILVERKERQTYEELFSS